MFATYISISSFNSSDIIIETLKDCLDSEVIDMIDRLYQEIKNNNIVINKSKS